MTTIKDWLEEDVEAGESFHFFIRGIREGNAALIERGLGKDWYLECSLKHGQLLRHRWRRRGNRAGGGFYHDWYWEC